MEEGVELIRQGLFAFQAELGVAYKYVSDTFQEHEKCNLQVIITQSQYVQCECICTLSSADSGLLQLKGALVWDQEEYDYTKDGHCRDVSDSRARNTVT